MDNRAVMLVTALAFAVPAAACVTTGTYEAKTAELEKLKRESSQRDSDSQAQIKSLNGRVADLEKSGKDKDERLVSTSAQRDELKGQLDHLKAQSDALKKQVDDTTALVGELKARLEKLGQNVNKLASEKGELSVALTDAKVRLDDLRKQKAAAEARAATFHNLVQRLHSMIDAGQIKVAIREGRMILALPTDVLFDSGKTAIKAEGQTALAQVSRVLSTIKDRRFLVAGHTDDVPIHTARFPSNWELSSARAIEVTRLLIASGMSASALAAAGYGEFDPVVPNDSVEHRTQNRRIEIVLQPNLADLPPMDSVDSSRPAGK